MSLLRASITPSVNVNDLAEYSEREVNQIVALIERLDHRFFSPAVAKSFKEPEISLVIISLRITGTR